MQSPPQGGGTEATTNASAGGSPKKTETKSPNKSPASSGSRSRSRSPSRSSYSSRSRSRSGSYSRSRSRSRSPARSKSPRKRSRSRSRRAKRSHSRSPSPEPLPTILHVGNLTRNVNKDHIQEIFAVYGKIKNIDFGWDKKVDLPKGFCYVEYETRADAVEAQEHMDGAQIDGNEVNCNFILIPKKNQVLDVSQLEDDLILQDAVAHLHFVVIDVVHLHGFSIDHHQEDDFHRQEDVYQDHVHLLDVDQDHLLEEEVDPHQEEECHDHQIEDVHLDL